MQTSRDQCEPEKMTLGHFLAWLLVLGLLSSMADASERKGKLYLHQAPVSLLLHLDLGCKRPWLVWMGRVLRVKLQNM